MNRIIVLFVLIMGSFTSSLAQKTPKYLLGVEGWCSFDNYQNWHPDGSGNSSYISNLTSTLYGGKLITSKTLFFFFFTTQYSTYKSKNISSNQGTAINYNYNITSLMPGLGIRQYFKLAEKDVAGLFLDFRLSGGTHVTKSKQTTTSDTITTINEGKANSRTASFNLMPGVYLNLTSKWQMLFKIGGLFYNTSWSNDPVNPKSTVTASKKGSYYGLDFNAQSFTISAARFF